MYYIMHCMSGFLLALKQQNEQYLQYVATKHMEGIDAMSFPTKANAEEFIEKHSELEHTCAVKI